MTCDVVSAVPEAKSRPFAPAGYTQAMFVCAGWVAPPRVLVAHQRQVCTGEHQSVNSATVSIALYKPISFAYAIAAATPAACPSLAGVTLSRRVPLIRAAPTARTSAESNIVAAQCDLEAT